MKTTVLITRFEEDAYALRHLDKRWRIRACRAYPGGYGTSGATAVIADLPPRGPRRTLDVEKATAAAVTLFGPAGAMASTTLADLRAKIGTPKWGDDWTQRPVTILDLRFDAELVARALACVSSRETVTVDVTEVEHTPVLRIIGVDWRACVAGMRPDRRMRAPVVKLKRLVTRAA